MDCGEYTDIYKDKNGEIHSVNVPSLESCLNGINRHFESANREIDFLQKENKKLKDGHYRDKELAQMKEKLGKAEEDLCRGFPITEDEGDAIREWTKTHCIEEHSGEYWQLTYEFIPTGTGIVGKVICSCGEEFCFRDA